MHTLSFYLFCFGLWYVLGRAAISRGARDWFAKKARPRRVALFLLDLIECPYCTGFWIGFILAPHFFGHDWVVLDALFWGGVVCGSNGLLASLAGLSD